MSLAATVIVLIWVFNCICILVTIWDSWIHHLFLIIFLLMMLVLRLWLLHRCVNKLRWVLSPRRNIGRRGVMFVSLRLFWVVYDWLHHLVVCGVIEVLLLL